MPITSAPFGRTAAGEAVERYTLTNANGVEARIITYGATLAALLAPDRDGTVADIVLGFDSLEGYLAPHPYLGSVVGRYGNRIARGRFDLDGVRYALPVNNGPNHLHGGPGGFHTRVWRATVAGETLGLTYVSADGEEGYPGRLSVAVAYTLTAANELRIAYAARAQAPTVLNLTNHAYFNLAGAGDILGHEVQIAAERFIPVDATQIPTGELLPVAGTPMDFRAAKALGLHIADDDAQLRGANGGFDHTWVFDHGGDLGAMVARVREPAGGRVLEVFTTQPGVQLYTGNFLDGSLVGKGGQTYAKHAALCLETQHFPDSPNQPAFPSTVLRPGERYQHTTVYRLAVE